MITSFFSFCHTHKLAVDSTHTDARGHSPQTEKTLYRKARGMSQRNEDTCQAQSLSGLKTQRSQNTGVLEHKLLERQTFFNKGLGGRRGPAA